MRAMVFNVMKLRAQAALSGHPEPLPGLSQVTNLGGVVQPVFNLPEESTPITIVAVTNAARTIHAWGHSQRISDFVTETVDVPVGTKSEFRNPKFAIPFCLLLFVTGSLRTGPSCAGARPGLRETPTCSTS